MKDWGVEGAAESDMEQKRNLFTGAGLECRQERIGRGLVGNSGLIENICSGPNSLRRAA